MQTTYLVFTVLGGTIMVVQFILTLIGMGGDDVDLDVDTDVEFDADTETGVDNATDVGSGDSVSHAGQSSWIFGVLTFRAIVAAITFLGLGGWFATSRGLSEPVPIGLGVACGIGAMFLVAWVMQLLMKLQSEGTARIERAIGTSGTVYLTVPALKSGAGKVTLSLQNRTMEYQAVTAQADALPTGAKITVVGIVSPGTVEVVLEA